MNKIFPKLSVIVTVYNTENFLEKCLDSLFSQSYPNIEVVLVNDASKGNCKEIAEKYSNKNIKYVEHDKNKGLFIARVTGAENATGDYIAFLDSDDYVTKDFYRQLVENAIENNSDIVIGNTILEYDDGRRIVQNIFDIAIPEKITGEECLKEYFAQEGLCFAWYTIWNKIYSKKVWDQAMVQYRKQDKHLIMTEDIAFSSIVYYYVKVLTKVNCDGIFYCKHEKTSTDVRSYNKEKFYKNLNDLITAFSFVENFMKEKNIYDKYSENFLRWKSLFAQIWNVNVSSSNLIDEEKKQVYDKVKEFYSGEEKKIDFRDYFYCVQTSWNDKLEKIKEEIFNEKIKYVSFDIFDTLILRPFLEPTDLFILLNEDFNNITDYKYDEEFSKIRVSAEIEVRKKKSSELSEITLTEIYDYISQTYNIDRMLLKIIEEKEIETEIRFCYRRNTGYELYRLALALGKKVICISDMYLSKESINKILIKNGYTEIDKRYVSSESKITKHSGELYNYVIKDLKIRKDEIIHIGDNYFADIEKAQENSINSQYLQSTKDAYISNNFGKAFSEKLPMWMDNTSTLSFLGTRCMLALVKNKYLDNPYHPIDCNTDFNTDSTFVGYYALGMNLFAISKWLLDSIVNKGYKKIVFLGEESYSQMKAYSILKMVYDNAPNEEYIEKLGELDKDKICIYTNEVNIKSIIKKSKIIGVDVEIYTETVSLDNSYSCSNINTFLEYKPAIDKNIRETLKNEFCSSTYQERQVIKIVQENAFSFIQDMVNTFGKDIHKLQYNKLEASIPFEFYIHSSNFLDKRILDCCYLEYENKEKVKFIDAWHQDKCDNNQHDIDRLIELNKYRNIVDLDEKTRTQRFFYYLFCDSKIFMQKAKIKAKKIFKRKNNQMK